VSTIGGLSFRSIAATYPDDGNRHIRTLEAILPLPVPLRTSASASIADSSRRDAPPLRVWVLHRHHQHMAIGWLFIRCRYWLVAGETSAPGLSIPIAGCE
jgi:hypothetical protein